MLIQGKTEGIVWEGVIPEVCQGCGLSAMFMMTIAAGKAGRFCRNGAVKLGNVPHLVGDIFMTIKTLVSHRRPTPWRSMTGFTLDDLRVRFDAVNVLAGLGV